MGMIGNFLRVTNTELEKYLEDSSLLEEKIYNEDSEDSALNDIDKSWEGILFLLTGQNLETLTHPLGQVLFSGQCIDEDQDLGYGPGQYLTPAQVKEIDSALSKITVEELTKNYDPKRMTELEVYPDIWEHEDALNYLLKYFEVVQEIYSIATKNNEAIITFIN